MTVLRFTVLEDVATDVLEGYLPSGSANSVSSPSPGRVVDIDVVAGDVPACTEYMESLGYTLADTDPATTLEEAGAGELPSAFGVSLRTPTSSAQYTGATAIADALAAASSGDVVLVGPGTYAESVTVPAGVHLMTDAGAIGAAKITGTLATGTRVTLSVGSTVSGFHITCPTDATYGVEYAGGIGTVAMARNLRFAGAGALGRSLGNTGLGSLLVDGIQYMSGTVSSLLDAISGALVARDVLIAGGTVTDGAYILNGSTAIISTYEIGQPATVGHAAHVEGPSIVVGSEWNFETPSVCLHIVDNGADIEVRNSRFNATTDDLRVDAGVSTGKLRLTGLEMQSLRINAPAAFIQNATNLWSYQDDIDGDLAWRIQGQELTVGHHLKGQETVLGEGDSHVLGLAAKTNTNGEIGTWNDISTEMASASSSTAAILAGTGAGNAFFFGGDVPFPGIKTNTLTALGLGAGAWTLTYWNGAAWVAVKHMAVDSGQPFGAHAATLMERTGSEQVRFGDMTGWATKLLDGDTKYWVKLEVTTAITTIPVLEQMKMHTNRFEANVDGTTEWFGTARPRLVYPLKRETMVQDNLFATPNEPIGWAVGINAHGTDNQMNNGQVDAVDGEITMPVTADTSFDLELVVDWAQMAAGAGDVEFEISYGLAKTGDVLDATNPVQTVSAIVAAPNVVNQLESFSVSLDIEDAVPGDHLVFQIKRDASGANPDDTLASNIKIVEVEVNGRSWRA